MRTETLVKVVLVQLLALAVGCGSSGTPSGSSTGGATSTGGGTTGGGTTGGTTGGGTTGVAHVGDACNFNVNTGADNCTAFGLECTSTISWVFCEGLDYPCPFGDSRLGGAGTCALPEEIGPCTQAVGCQDAGPSATGESNTFVCAGDPTATQFCVYQCSHTSECGNISESCQIELGQNICTYNYCDLDNLGNPVGPFFDACNAAGSGDGECLAYGGSPAQGSVCYQNGSVAHLDVCQAYRTNGSNDSLCVFGDFCVPDPADPVQATGVCMQLADGTAGHPCANVTDKLLYPVIGANFGICAPGCTADIDCPPHTTCHTVEDGKACLP